MLGAVLQGEACAIFLRERTSPAWAFVGSEWYVISSLSNIDGDFSISLILML